MLGFGAGDRRDRKVHGGRDVLEPQLRHRGRHRVHLVVLRRAADGRCQRPVQPGRGRPLPRAR